MSNTHQLVFYTAPREAVHIANLIAAGGEGGVYNVFEHPDLVAKIFHPKQRTAAIADKLQVMMQFHPTADVNTHRHHVLIAWPTHIIYKTPSAQPSYTSANGTENLVVGYLMPKLKHTYSIAQLLNPNFRAKHHPELNHRHIYRVAINLVRVVGQLHASGIVIGDINEKNFHFTKELDRVALVSIIDCDSMQITAPTGDIYPCTVVVPEYTAPELHGKDIRKGVIRTEAHDQFGLAVLLYKLLMQGFHPFQGIPSAGMPQVESAQVWCIKNNVFPHIANSFYEPPRYAPRITSLPAVLTTLFLRAFLKGYTRPTAHEWEVALTELEQTLVACANDDSHIHPAGHPCVVCEWEYANGKRATGGQVVPAELSDLPLPPLIRTSTYAAAATVPTPPSVQPVISAARVAPAPSATPPVAPPPPVNVEPPPTEPIDRVIPPSVWSSPAAAARLSSQSNPLPIIPSAVPIEATPSPAAGEKSSSAEPVTAAAPEPGVPPQETPDPAETDARPQIRPSVWSAQPVSQTPPPTYAAPPPAAMPPVFPPPSADIAAPSAPRIPPALETPLPVDLAHVPTQIRFSGAASESPEELRPSNPTARLDATAVAADTIAAPPDNSAAQPDRSEARPSIAPSIWSPAVPPAAPVSREPEPRRSVVPEPELPAVTLPPVIEPVVPAAEPQASNVTDTLEIIDDLLPPAPSVPRSVWSTPLQTTEATRLPIESALRPLDELPPLPATPAPEAPLPEPTGTVSSAPTPIEPVLVEPSPVAPEPIRVDPMPSRALWANEPAGDRSPTPAIDPTPVSPRTQFLPPLPDEAPVEPPPASATSGRSLWSTPLQPHEATRVPVESGTAAPRPYNPADAIPIMTTRSDAPAQRSSESADAQPPLAPRIPAAAFGAPNSARAGTPTLTAGLGYIAGVRGDTTVWVQGDTVNPALQPAVGLNGVVAVAAGRQHLLALRYDGTVHAWGANNHGQTLVPSGLPDIHAVAAGAQVSLALTGDQRVVAWGDDSAQQCQVPAGLDGVTAIAVGGTHAMALRRDGTVVEWGTLDRDALLDARGVTDAVAIAAGDGMSVALQRDGSVVCWGPRVGSARAAVRQLPPIRLIGCAQQTIVAIDQADTLHVIGAAQPVAPTRLDGATALALTDTLIAVAAASGVWVVDATGARPLSVQSAHGTRITRAATPQRIAIQQLVHRLAPPIAAGYEHTVAIAADGYALSWGDNTYGQRTAPAQALVAVAAGGWHALGYDRDGRIHAWGRSNHGQTLFATVNKFRAVGIAAGMVHSIAVGDDGRVLAWGNNDAGQCSVPALAGAGVAVAAGMRHSVVLLDDGTVQAWGNNSAGQTTVPADLRDVVAVAAGGQSSAALRADGTLVVWGELAARAGGVTGLRDITAVTLGGEHGAVLLRDGRIECFGNDDYGQCHPGRALPPIAAIACGTLHTVALSTTGELFAWGRDSYQQTHIPAGVVFRR